jgi:hypothetical protein
VLCQLSYTHHLAKGKGKLYKPICGGSTGNNPMGLIDRPIVEPTEEWTLLGTCVTSRSVPNVLFLGYGRNRRNRRAFETTVTDDSPIAAAARMGESKTPKRGKRTPAATGMSTTL